MNSAIPKTGWASGPSGRGTISLLWDCFATILLCTWSAVHPNLPADDDTELVIFGRRARYVVMTIVVPEYTTTLAFIGFMKARRRRSKSTLKWSLKHFFLVTMGGFALETPDGLVRIHGDVVIKLIENGTMLLPNVQEPDIDDRSKANWVTKAIAMLQVTWFSAKLIGRAANRLPVTTLELFTLGVVICAIMTYAFWWHKPFDVQRPVILQPSLSPEQKYKLSEEDLADVKRMRLSGNSDMAYGHLWIFGLAGTLFGALHVVAWNFEFPTETEKMLWRIGCIALVCVPLVFTGTTAADKMGLPGMSVVAQPFAIVLSVFYVLMRLYLLVEMFVGLRKVPVGVYETVKWARYIPSFG